MEQTTLAQKIARILDNKKALDITVLHVAHLTVITDYMVIASGRSSLQVKSLADDVDDALAMEGIQLRSKEGNAEGRWIVLDYGTCWCTFSIPRTGNSITWKGCGTTARTACPWISWRNKQPA